MSYLNRYYQPSTLWLCHFFFPHKVRESDIDIVNKPIWDQLHHDTSGKQQENKCKNTKYWPAIRLHIFHNMSINLTCRIGCPWKFPSRSKLSDWLTVEELPLNATADWLIGCSSLSPLWSFRFSSNMCSMFRHVDSWTSSLQLLDRRLGHNLELVNQYT